MATSFRTIIKNIADRRRDVLLQRRMERETMMTDPGLGTNVRGFG
jgi:hypothetical protein